MRYPEPKLTGNTIVSPHTSKKYTERKQITIHMIMVKKIFQNNGKFCNLLHIVISYKFIDYIIKRYLEFNQIFLNI